MWIVRYFSGTSTQIIITINMITRSQLTDYRSQLTRSFQARKVEKGCIGPDYDTLMWRRAHFPKEWHWSQEEALWNGHLSILWQCATSTTFPTAGAHKLCCNLSGSPFLCPSRGCFSSCTSTFQSPFLLPAAFCTCNGPIPANHTVSKL